jgi:hypothetical protein
VTACVLSRPRRRARRRAPPAANSGSGSGQRAAARRLPSERARRVRGAARGRGARTRTFAGVTGRASCGQRRSGRPDTTRSSHSLRFMTRTTNARASAVFAGSSSITETGAPTFRLSWSAALTFFSISGESDVMSRLRRFVIQRIDGVVVNIDNVTQVHRGGPGQRHGGWGSFQGTKSPARRQTREATDEPHPVRRQ